MFFAVLSLMANPEFSGRRKTFMRKIWLMMAAGLFLTACGSVSLSSSAEYKPKAGETVAYKISRDGLREGIVESVDGARYKIKYGASVETADESDIYALPKAGAKPPVKAGDMVAAKIFNSELFWYAAEVASVNGDVIEVKALNRGNTASLSPDKIIVVRPAAVAEFQKLKTENEFTAKARQTRPHAPNGYKPQVGDHVVAEWSGGSWWVGDVSSVAGDKVKIKWENFGESEIMADKVVPYPKAETSAALPAAGSYVLVKPEGGKGQWFYAQVAAVNGGSAEVKFSDGKTRSIKPDECIALS
jgi:hypothetical protein